MEERDIVSVTAIEDSDWDETGCMRTRGLMDPGCQNTADKVIKLQYEDEEFYTYTAQCSKHAADYVRRWDMAQIYGDEVLDRNEFQLK